MSGNLRKEVLNTFKKLHRTRLNTFSGDSYALEVTRKKINEEYKKCKEVTNAASITELNEYAKAVEHEVRTTVIQAKQVEPGRFAARITPDVLIDNVPFDENYTIRQVDASSFKKCSDFKKK